jgi:hypothetical protein
LLYRVQVFIVSSNVTPLSGQRVTGSRYQAMDVRMQPQVLSPGVKHGHCSGLTTKMSISIAVKGTSNGIEQDVTIKCLVPQVNPVQYMGHGKDDVKMLYRKRIVDQFLYPLELLVALAFGTVSVAATVVGILYGATIVAYLLVTTQNWRPTRYNIVEHLYLAWRQGLVLHQVPSKSSYHISQFRLVFTIHSHTGYPGDCAVL